MARSHRSVARRLLLTVITLGTAAAAATGPGPGEASAAPEPPAPPGLQLIQHVGGAMTVSDHKFATLSCPRNPVVKVPLGGGARIRTPNGVGGDGVIKFTALQPFDIGGTGTYVYAASAFAKPGHDKPWTIDIWVLCGEAPPGYEIVLPDNSDDPPDDDPFNDPKTGVGHVRTTVRCPDGKKLLAAGAALSPATFDQRGRISLSEIIPAADGRSATVAGNDDATDGDGMSRFTLYPVRVCANDPAGHQVVTGTNSALDTAPAKTRTAGCPAGTIAYGAGFSKVDTAGHAYPDGAVPGSLDGNGLPRRYTIRAEQAAPLLTWSLRAYVICANPLD